MTDPRFEELDCLYTPETQKLMNGTAYKLLLATKVVRLASKNGGLLVLQRNGIWMPVSDGLKACQVLVDQWGGIPVAFKGEDIVLTTQQIKGFVNGEPKLGLLPEVPIISGRMMAPTSDALAIQYRGLRYVNTWRNTIMPGDPEAMQDSDVRLYITVLLRMIREGLAGKDDVLDWETMIAKLHSRAEDEVVFRFIMNWWAAQVQRPGINLQTNLAHLGPNQGVGKGTFQEVMRQIMGGDLVLTANADEFARGWTDQMLNRICVCVNEIGQGSGRAAKQTDWNLFAKTYCNEAEITVASRYLGVGAGPIPNFTNWCFTSNDERPWRVDDDDRRSAMFPTNNSKAKNHLAQDMQELLHSENTDLIRQVMQAFAHILHSLPVEHELISKPVENELREENKTANIDDVLYWLMDDNNYDRDVEHLPGYWADRYNTYHNDPEHRLHPKAMSSVMQGLVRRGEILGRSVVTGKRAPNGKMRKKWYFVVPSEAFPKEGEADSPRKARQKQRMDELRTLSAPQEPSVH